VGDAGRLPPLAVDEERQLLQQPLTSENVDIACEIGKHQPLGDDFGGHEGRVEGQPGDDRVQVQERRRRPRHHGRVGEGRDEGPVPQQGDGEGEEPVDPGISREPSAAEIAIVQLRPGSPFQCGYWDYLDCLEFSGPTKLSCKKIF